MSSTRMSSSSSSMYHHHQQQQQQHHQDYRGSRHHYPANPQVGARSSMASSSSSATSHILHPTGSSNNNNSNNNHHHHQQQHHSSSYHHHQSSNQHSNHQSVLLPKLSQQQHLTHQSFNKSVNSNSNKKNESSSRVIMQPPQQQQAMSQPGDDEWLRTSNSPEPDRKEEPNRLTPHQRNWLFGQEYYDLRSPARLLGISAEEEQANRIIGCNMIRDIVRCLKIKTICKETANVYFHRFFIVRPLRSVEQAMRIATAATYLACKFEEHPIFKEAIVKVYHLLKCQHYKVPAVRLHKEDKDYQELCDRLLLDENRMLQTLGFSQLQVQHFPVMVVEACGKRPDSMPHDLYQAAYQIAAEMNRLTPVSVLYPAPLLACVAINLAATFKTFSLPSDWYANLIPNASANILALVSQVSETYRETLARNSSVIDKYKSKLYLAKYEPNGSPSEGPGGATSRSQGPSTKHISQQFTNFSPDSAYSSSSSAYSPNEKMPGSSASHGLHPGGNQMSKRGVDLDVMQPIQSCYQSSSSAHQQQQYQVKRSADDVITPNLAKRPRGQSMAMASEGNQNNKNHTNYGTGNNTNNMYNRQQLSSKPVFQYPATHPKSRK